MPMLLKYGITVHEFAMIMNWILVYVKSIYLYYVSYSSAIYLPRINGERYVK